MILSKPVSLVLMSEQKNGDWEVASWRRREKEFGRNKLSRLAS